ncbi:MAG TPA: hypothetical protein VK459_17260 [Polyangiaceae bacterium]|jgi:hypothetical protein|nr:hypothetical protein [Polyangiaceae bacterium]
MKSIAVLLGIIVLTSLAFWPMTGMAPGDASVSSTQVLGKPVLGVGTGEVCWLSLGTGFGVLFVGLAGAGVVALGLGGGGGLLFGTGQLSCGLIAMGQLAIGVVFTLGQLGVGMAALGQVVLGGFVKGQAALGKDGGAFLSQLNQDIDRVLWPRRGAEPPGRDRTRPAAK